VVEVACELAHGEVGLAAEEAAGLADDAGGGVVIGGGGGGGVVPEVEADFAVELLVLVDGLDAVAGLVEAGVAGIAVEHLVAVVALGAEADLAVSLEQALQLLQLGPALLPLLLLQAQLLDHRYLQRVLQHALGLVAVAALEAQQHLSHPQLLLDLRNLPLLLLRPPALLPHARSHFPPVLQVGCVVAREFRLPEGDLALDLLSALRVDHVEVQQFPHLFLAVLHVDDVQLQPRQSLHLGAVRARVAEGGEVEGAVDCAAGVLAQVVVLLEGEGHQLVVLPPLQLHLPPEQHAQEAGTAQVGVLRSDALREVVPQLCRGMPQLQQLVRTRPL
jgi:hypothetical protein